MRILSEGVHKAGSYDLDLVNLLLQKKVTGAGCNRRRIGKARRVGIFEFRSQLTAGSSDELRCFASGCDEDRRLRIKLGSHTEHIAVQCSAQTLIGGNENHCSLSNVALFQQWMAELSHAGGRFPLDTVQEVGKGAATQRGLLRFSHFRRCHHLHRFRNLRRATDGPDASA